MLADKEDLEKHKEALLMKEEEALQKDKEVQLEMRKVEDIGKRIDDKVESLHLPPPKYFFPPVGGAGHPYASHLPNVYCRSCKLHHHPHHHCHAGSDCSYRPKVLRENFVYFNNPVEYRTPKLKGSKSLADFTGRHPSYFERNRDLVYFNPSGRYIDYNHLSKYYS